MGLPIATENSLECVALMCKHEGVQQHFIQNGLVWASVPLLLAYDNTLRMEDHLMDLENKEMELQRSKSAQAAANMHAILAAKVLGSLGGYLTEEDVRTKEQPEVKEALGSLLSIPISNLLRFKRPNKLLLALNENC